MIDKATEFKGICSLQERNSIPMQYTDVVNLA